MSKIEKDGALQLREQNVKTVVEMMPKEFDSHDFIRRFIWECPKTYGELLIKHNNVKNAHAEISNYLRNYANELEIEQLPDRNSADIFGNTVLNANWTKK